LNQFNPEIAMKKALVILAVLSLAGCGAETATTAATAAVIKKQEIEQGKQTLDQAQQKINQSMQQMQQNAQKAAD
jgi:hypothetical protein